MNDPYNPSYEPSESIRSDLWPTMNISELTNQQDLVLTKISALSSIMSAAPPQTLRNIYSALQAALTAINELIERQMAQKQ